jgi:hypothetical protein
MPKSYTQDDLILFIYNELPENEKFSVQKALDSNPELYKTYHMLLQVVGSLDSLNYEPHPTSIEIILEHSQHEEQHFH